MRFRITCGALVVCFCALTAFAQQPLTVDKLTQFVRSSISQKLPDKDIASYLAGVKMTERLTPHMVEDLQGAGAGPKTLAALAHLAELSATLPAPAPKVAAAAPKLPPPPPPEEQQKILAEVREYALNYSASLPDFICLEDTRRYMDRHYKPDTEGSWAIFDRLVEKLTYFEQKEKYEALMHNDTSLYGKSAESVGGALSRGDFGSILKEIFVPETDAEFRWERWGNLDGHWMHVYSYHVDQPHSQYTIDYDRGAQRATPGYHGEIFVDRDSHLIMRITLVAEPPANFPMQDIKQVLDYRYVDLSGQKFLLPASGTVVSLTEGMGNKNEISFRQYKKYSADAVITFDDKDSPDAPAQPDQQK